MIKDVWQYLAGLKKPVILYGMGNGADKILSVFERYGIKASGIFVSDGFVRPKLFHGMPLESYSDVCSRLSDFTVVVSFASHLPEVISNVRRIASERELIIPEVPVVSDSELFNGEFFLAHKDEISKARDLFEDEESLSLYDSIIDYRLYGSPDSLFSNTSSPEKVFSEILRPENYTSYVDAGAYTGDTVLQLQQYSKSLNYILALEPDAKNYAKLVRNCEGTEGFVPVNAGAWDKEDEVIFSSGLGRGSVISKQGKAVRMSDIDSLLAGKAPDYIKYDVEGAEKRALLGTENTIKQYAPDLCVSLYHRSEDIFELPLMLHEMQKEYSFFLRRFYCMPAWDLNLYAVKK